MTKYAIVNAKTREFYADPAYSSKEEAEKKIRYLANYEVLNRMKATRYEVEELTPARETEHDKEWNMFVSCLD